MGHLKVDKKGKYNIVGLSEIQAHTICFLLDKLNDNCFDKEGNDYYSNDNFVVKLNSKQRQALKSFIKNLI